MIMTMIMMVKGWLLLIRYWETAAALASQADGGDTARSTHCTRCLVLRGTFSFILK